MSVSAAVTSFLKNVTCLIVEPSAPFQSAARSCLIQLGAQKENIYSALRVEDAIPVIEKMKPKLIITEYQIKNKFGVTLVEQIDKLVGENERVAIFATKNSSETAVAEAAEGQIDAYILKPFSMGEFQKKIEEAIQLKVVPSPYLQAIKEGRLLLEQSQPSLAMEKFNLAKTLSPKPSLAFYYCGYIHGLGEKTDMALNEYEKGLEISPLHYRCLLGEFDSYFKIKKYDSAYKLISVITKNYPVSSARLASMMITLIHCKAIADVPALYDIFMQMDYRSDELVNVTLAALKTAGKSMLREKHFDKAFEFFERGVSASHLDTKFIHSCVHEMLKANDVNHAELIYRRWPGDKIQSDEHQVLGFLIDCKTLPKDQALEKGRKILTHLIQGEPDFYRELAKLAIDLDKKTTAEDIITKGVRNFPDLRQELYALLES